jgi:hypothetical protein
MRVATVMLLIAAVVAAAPGVAAAQESASRAASELPAELFDPPRDGVPAGARGIADDGTRASIMLAVTLLAAAAVVGYLAGSSSRTSRS